MNAGGAGAIVVVVQPDVKALLIFYLQGDIGGAGLLARQQHRFDIQIGKLIQQRGGAREGVGLEVAVLDGQFEAAADEVGVVVLGAFHSNVPDFSLDHQHAHHVAGELLLGNERAHQVVAFALVDRGQVGGGLLHIGQSQGFALVNVKNLTDFLVRQQRVALQLKAAYFEAGGLAVGLGSGRGRLGGSGSQAQREQDRDQSPSQRIIPSRSRRQ